MANIQPDFLKVMKKERSCFDRREGRRCHCLSPDLLHDVLYTKSHLILLPTQEIFIALLLPKRKLNSIRSRAGIQIQVL